MALIFTALIGLVHFALRLNTVLACWTAIIIYLNVDLSVTRTDQIVLSEDG